MAFFSFFPENRLWHFLQMVSFRCRWMLSEQGLHCLPLIKQIFDTLSLMCIQLVIRRLQVPSSSGPATFFLWDQSRNIFYGQSILLTDSSSFKGSCQFPAKECAQVLVNCLEDMQSLPRKKCGYDHTMSSLGLNTCPAEYIKMPCPLPIYSQSDYLIQIVAINLHT